MNFEDKVIVTPRYTGVGYGNGPVRVYSKEEREAFAKERGQDSIDNAPSNPESVTSESALTNAELTTKRRSASFTIKTKGTAKRGRPPKTNFDE